MDPGAPPARPGLTERLSRLRSMRRTSGASSSLPPPRGDQENDAPAPAVRKDRASPPARSTPAASARAVSGSTGDRLAALKALRVASRPNSGRRAGSPGSAPGDRDACAAVLPERTPRSPRGDATLRPTSRPTRGDADPEPERVPAAAARRDLAVAVSNEWREFAPAEPADVRRAESAESAESHDSAAPSVARSSDRPSLASRARSDAGRLRNAPEGGFGRTRKADVTFEPARIVCLLADAHLDPAESAVRVVVPNPKDDARSRAGGGGSLSTAAAAAAAALPVALSLARPRTTVRREYRVSACVDTAVETTPRESDATAAAVIRAGEDDAVPGRAGSKDLFPRSFAAAVSDAVLSGVGCALFSLGAGKCGKSRAVRGASPRAADSESSDSLGVAGMVADALFAARRDALEAAPGDSIAITVRAIADVIAAPPAGALGVASKAARRKTHEVLFDALAEGVDRAVAFEPNSNRLRTADADASGGVRGGRGPGAASCAAAFHGEDGSRPIAVGVREHPRRGFYAEGAVELVARDAADARRLVAAALDGFGAREAACKQKQSSRGGGGGANAKEGGGANAAAPLSRGGGDSRGERAHLILKFGITRRRGGAGVRVPTLAHRLRDPAELGLDSADPKQSPSRDVFSSVPSESVESGVWVVDFASVECTSAGAAEDAAHAALSRVLDALGSSPGGRVGAAGGNRTSHVPYRDSKLTRLVKPALDGSARLFALVGASRDPARFDAADAALSVARRIAGAVRCAPVRRAVRHAEEVREADARARDARDAMLRGEEDGRLSVEGVLSSSDVHLDADASDALVAFRDALADGEQARREAEAFEETAERSDRARAATRF